MVLAILARFGNVIYWASRLVAGTLAVFCLWSMITDPNVHYIYNQNRNAGLLIAVGIWVFGLAIRYILVGPSRTGLINPVAVAVFAIVMWLIAGSTSPTALAWFVSAIAALAAGFLVMTWQVWDLHRLAPFNATNTGGAFSEAFNFSYAYESNRKAGLPLPLRHSHWRHTQKWQPRTDGAEDLLEEER